MMKTLLTAAAISAVALTGTTALAGPKIKLEPVVTITPR